MILTLAQLRHWGACGKALLRFKQTFGESVTLNKQNIARWDNRYDLVWVLLSVVRNVILVAAAGCEFDTASMNNVMLFYRSEIDRLQREVTP